MQRRVIPPSGLFFTLLLFALGATALPAATSGTASNAKSAPRRIISLSPGITEILYALGLGNKVVGDTTYCDYPPAAKRKTHIGDSVTNYEEVVALRPDLVIGDSLANESAFNRLWALRVPCAFYPFRTLQQLASSIAQIGIITDRMPEAKALLLSMQMREERARMIVASKKHPIIRTVFIVSAHPLWIAGGGSFIGSGITSLGAVDVAPDTDYQSWSIESLIAARPSVIFCSQADRSVILADPAWQAIPAVQDGNVFAVAPDIAERPGPRFPDALLEMAREIAGAKL